MRAKTIMVLSDLHCGHWTGLVPPSKHFTPTAHTSDFDRERLGIMRRLWSIFSKNIRKFPVPDLLVINGDAIDGRGERSGSSELISGATDQDVQAAMAAECIKFVKAPVVMITAGTAYHTGNIEDKERLVATLVKESKHTKKCEFHGSLEVSVNGHVFDFKHHIGGGQASTASDVALRHEDRHNSDWAEIGVQSRADVIVRSHQHQFRGGWLPGGRRMAFVTPALQALGTKYGRRLSKTVDWGFMWFDVDKNGVRPLPVIPKEVVPCHKRKTVRV